MRSVGRKGDSYDNAAAESLNSLYKRELIDLRGDWKGADDVMVATADWVRWYNEVRIHSYSGDMPPKMYEEIYSGKRWRLVNWAPVRRHEGPLDSPGRTGLAESCMKRSFPARRAICSCRDDDRLPRLTHAESAALRACPATWHAVLSRTDRSFKPSSCPWSAPASLEALMSANWCPVYQTPVLYSRFPRTFSAAYRRCKNGYAPRYTTAPSLPWRPSHHQPLSNRHGDR